MFFQTTTIYTNHPITVGGGDLLSDSEGLQHGEGTERNKREENTNGVASHWKNDINILITVSSGIVITISSLLIPYNHDNIWKY